jgi:hypothetical protein
MTKNKNKKDQIILYTDKEGKVELRADMEKETLWATQAQIAQLFKTERSVVTKHINNILIDDEVDQKSNVQKMHIANSDRPTALYSLDIILAVGYRTNSNKAIAFRKWATSILRECLIKGFYLDQRKLVESKEDIDGLHEAIALIESKKHLGRLKSRVTIRMTKDFLP